MPQAGPWSTVSGQRSAGESGEVLAEAAGEPGPAVGLFDATDEDLILARALADDSAANFSIGLMPFQGPYEITLHEAVILARRKLSGQWPLRSRAGGVASARSPSGGPSYLTP